MIFSFFKGTNFDFERTTYQTTDFGIIVQAFFIPEDQECPRCHSKMICKNGHIENSVLHCVNLYHPIIVVLHIQGYICKDCKKVFYEKNTFSNPKESLSKESIFVILDRLKRPNETFESIAKDFYVSRTTVMNIFDRYIDYNHGKLPDIISLDEKHISKQMTDRSYMCIILDFRKNKIYDILENRRKTTLERYFRSFSKEERENVKFVTMDMWETYRDVAKYCFPNAKIVVDSFHIIKLINNALTYIRISVMQKFNNKSKDIEGNHPFYYVLKKYNYFLTKDIDDLPNNRFFVKKLNMYFDKYSMIKYILDIDDNLKKAYELTKEYREFNRSSNIDYKEELEELIEKFNNSKLKVYIDISYTLSNWKECIINSFNYVTCGEETRRLSNGPIEGLNATLEKININGNGYSNFKRFRNRAIYCINNDAPIKNNKN